MVLKGDCTKARRQKQEGEKRRHVLEGSFAKRAYSDIRPDGIEGVEIFAQTKNSARRAPALRHGGPFKNNTWRVRVRVKNGNEKDALRRWGILGKGGFARGCTRSGSHSGVLLLVAKDLSMGKGVF